MTARFGIGSVLATSVRIWARNLPRFIAITAVLYLPWIAWILVGQIDALRDWVPPYYEVLYWNPVLRALPGGWFVVNTCTAAAVTHGALVALTGRPVPIGRGLGTAVRRFFPVIGVALVVWLATSGVVAVPDLLVWPSWLGELASDGLLLCYIVLASLFYLAVPIATVERRAVAGSIARGFGLARGGRIRVFAIVLVWEVAWWGSSRLIAFVVLPGPGADLADLHTALQIDGSINLGLNVVLSSLGSVMAAVTYRLLREDKDGPSADELVTVFE